MGLDASAVPLQSAPGAAAVSVLFGLHSSCSSAFAVGLECLRSAFAVGPPVPQQSAFTAVAVSPAAVPLQSVPRPPMSQQCRYSRPPVFPYCLCSRPLCLHLRQSSRCNFRRVPHAHLWVSLLPVRKSTGVKPKAATLPKGTDFLEATEDAQSSSPPLPQEDKSSHQRWVTLQWAEPLQSRKAFYVQLSVMRAVSRLRANGIPEMRFHNDRAREFLSPKLAEWLARQRIYGTKSAPEDHASNGAAEVCVRQLNGQPGNAYWPLVSRPDIGRWQFAMRANSFGVMPWCHWVLRCGLCTLSALPLKNRLRLRQRSTWSPRTVPGRLVGPAPQTLSSYLVLLPDKQLYISAAIYPAGRPAPASAPAGLPPPSRRHRSKTPVVPSAVQLIRPSLPS